MTLDRRLPILVSPPTLPLSRNFATSQYRSGDGGVSVGRAQGRSDDCCSQKNYKNANDLATKRRAQGRYDDCCRSILAKRNSLKGQCLALNANGLTSTVFFSVLHSTLIAMQISEDDTSSPFSASLLSVSSLECYRRSN
ncbi:hypothetical protein MUK42_05894 [Musa troglodytarum]|uniref:Uncharacterized protein n=1 Tax=Musa troglodytarum TaxID=320322 RepID=A0A9E7GMP8_9LILI|nr:hypothetical protein MUK42_05894 [Musa troglodytarum]